MLVQITGYRKLYLESQDLETGESKKRENFEFSRECHTGRFTFIFLLNGDGLPYGEISIPAHAIPNAKEGRNTSWSDCGKKYTMRFHHETITPITV